MMTTGRERGQKQRECIARRHSDQDSATTDDNPLGLPELSSAACRANPGVGLVSSSLF